jgi:hypothetical protein
MYTFLFYDSVSFYLIMASVRGRNMLSDNKKEHEDSVVFIP